MPFGADYKGEFRKELVRRNLLQAQAGSSPSLHMTNPPGPIPASIGRFKDLILFLSNAVISRQVSCHPVGPSAIL